MPPAHAETEGDAGEVFVRRRAQLAPSHVRRDDLPLAVLTVRVKVDGGGRHRQVHLARVVGPRAEDESARLLVEREVGHVDGTHRVEDAARLPADLAAVRNGRAELLEVVVNLIGSAAERGHNQRNCIVRAGFIGGERNFDTLKRLLFPVKRIVSTLHDYLR